MFDAATVPSLAGSVRYNVGAKNIGRWTPWPKGMPELSTIDAATNVAG